jgi:hypothetical protein
MAHYLGDDCPGGHQDEEKALLSLVIGGMSIDDAKALIARLKGKALGETLGPWQGGFDAWGELEGYMRTFPPDHFQTIILTQIIEVREQLALGDLEHAVREMNDIISVALNWMRSLGFSAEDIARIVRGRAANRYVGQVRDIMETYQAKYGI